MFSLKFKCHLARHIPHSLSPSLSLSPQTSRYLALPYMVWTVLCTAVAGMFGISLLIAFPSVHSSRQHYLPPEAVTRHLVLGMVLPFVFVVVMFKLYTWWLIVVFDFYNRIRFAAGGPPFDTIQMQAA